MARPETRSDGDLLRAYRGGDPAAVTELVERHQTALLRHARALVGDGHRCEDVVQEAFLRMVQEPPELPAAASVELERAYLAGWLHRVTRNLCMDAQRSEARRKTREEEAAANEAVSGGIAEIEEADTRAAVERGLERLPAEQREVLVLRLLGERSYREIAEITGRKVGTIGWLISTGLKLLAAELETLVAAPARVPTTSAAPAKGEAS